MADEDAESSSGEPLTVFGLRLTTVLGLLLGILLVPYLWFARRWLTRAIIVPVAGFLGAFIFAGFAGGMELFDFLGVNRRIGFLVSITFGMMLPWLVILGILHRYTDHEIL
ncbi:hypothetical protein [Haloarcula argentinensis]|uniref:Uncharacterized protein n=1 Tax=Haloarcula argentinensis TaxID=43776 RepID=A0A830FIT7_HALAR|nr:hypothetical protein [Haloarcula argentinensis]EMA24781.1 hypothetical protein C443_06464 [Haloarcula argentinensis DSM 12282]MDS0253103.1 hypothetical protein [Haloarcula argentinensis]GGM27053.1 hypothetical protein GCM10009006_05660 [Haloarcula argentinensis]